MHTAEVGNSGSSVSGRDYFEDVLAKWEGQLREYVDDFERYSRAMSELDSTLFEYVIKLEQCRAEQESVENKQQHIINKVTRVEAQQKMMMDTITRLQQKVTDRDSETDSSLETKAQEVNKSVQDLESAILALGKDIDALEQCAYDEDLSELIHAVNSHARILNKFSSAMSTM